MLFRIFASLLIVLASVPNTANADRRGRSSTICVPCVTNQAIVSTSTVLIETPILVSAVSFQYVQSAAPAPQQVPGIAQASRSDSFAAEPYDARFATAVRTSGTQVASLLQQRCGACHQQDTKGGVRLLDMAGQLVLSKRGQPLSKIDIARIVKSGRMPPSSPLPEAERNILTEWILDPS